jgi:hypothetical protein
VYQAGDSQAVLGFLIIDTVPAGYDRTGLGDFFGPAAQNLAQDLYAKVVRKGDQIDGKKYPPAHGVNIGQGVGGRDRAEVVGIINNRREEIGRGDNRLFFIQAKYGRIICAIQTDQEVRIIGRFKCLANWFQRLFQLRRSQLRRSTSAGSVCGKTNLFAAQNFLHKSGRLR